MLPHYCLGCSMAHFFCLKHRCRTSSSRSEGKLGGTKKKKKSVAVSVCIQLVCTAVVKTHMRIHNPGSPLKAASQDHWLLTGVCGLQGVLANYVITPRSFENVSAVAV